MTDIDNARLRRQRNWALGIAGASLTAFGVTLVMRGPGDATLLQEPPPPPSPSSQGQDTKEPSAAEFPKKPQRTDANPSAKCSPQDRSLSADQAAPTDPSLPDTIEAARDPGQNPVDQFFSGERWQDNPLFLHDEFRRERRNEQWAYGAETNIGDFVARHPFAHAYEDLWVECHASLCQIYAEVEKSMAMAIQQSTVRDMNPFSRMSFESLGNEFEMASGSFGTADNDRLNMVITLRRRE